MLIWLTSLLRKYKIGLYELDEILLHLRRSLIINPSNKGIPKKLIRSVRNFCEKKEITRDDEFEFIERIKHLWISVKG